MTRYCITYTHMPMKEQSNIFGGGETDSLAQSKVKIHITTALKLSELQASVNDSKPYMAFWRIQKNLLERDHIGNLFTLHFLKNNMWYKNASCKHFCAFLKLGNQYWIKLNWIKKEKKVEQNYTRPT